ncbi:MAG: sugar phosphate isomerase/epimerase [Lentisphaeria bacterium]|jgi:sugar phosphate isomerase/epimerase
MFKKCFCSIAFRGEPLEAIIPKLAAIGYDGIEVWGNHLGGRSDADVLALRKLATENRLDIEVLSPYFWLTRDLPELEAQSLATAARFVHLATLLGAPKIRTFVDAGPDGIGSAAATPAHWNRAVGHLKTITAMAPGILFAMETHAHTLADTPASTLRLLDRVGAPNLKVLYQPEASHTIENYRRLRPHVVHLHLQNTGANGGPGYLEEGLVDFPGLFRELAADGYAASLSVEYCWPGVTWTRAQSAYAYLMAKSAMGAA